MASFLRGVGAALNRVGEVGLADALERRRQEGLLKIQQQLAQENYKQQRADAVADRDVQLKAQTESEQRRIAAQAEEGRLTREQTDRIARERNAAGLEEARISAGARNQQAQYESATIEELVRNPDGSLIFTTDAQGNQIPVTRKIAVPFNKFTGTVGGQSGGDEVDIPDDLLKRIRGEKPEAAGEAAVPPASGLLKQAQAAKPQVQGPPAPPPPIMRQGKQVQFAPPEPVYRQGKLVEQR